MKRINTSAASPQRKLMHTNNKMGNKSIKMQQGATIEVYDMIEVVTGKSEYEFFIDARSKSFPFTNLTRGVLQPQESFVMERAYLMLVTEAEDGTVTKQEPLDLALAPYAMMGEFIFMIDNDRVLKSIPLRSFDPQFNPDADANNTNVFEFDTQLVVPPLIEFTAKIKIPDGALDTLIPVDGRVLLGVTLGGPGALFAPKNTY